jgi:hypothetical protein
MEQNSILSNISNDKAALYRYCEAYSKSSFAPSGLRDKANDCYIIALKGMSLGLSPMASLDCMYVINNKPTLYGDAVIMLGKLSKDYCSHDCEFTGEGETYKCTITIHKKNSKTPFVYSYSYQDAKAEGKFGNGGVWKSYTRDMIFRRASRKAFTMCFPESYMGTIASEYNSAKEIDANTEIKDVTDTAEKPNVYKLFTPKTETVEEVEKVEIENVSIEPEQYKTIDIEDFVTND